MAGIRLFVSTHEEAINTIVSPQQAVGVEQRHLPGQQEQNGGNKRNTIILISAVLQMCVIS